MKAEEIKYNQTTYCLQSWSRQRGLNPLPIEKAEGIYMYDFDGNRYTDMSSQLVNLNVGHATPRCMLPFGVPAAVDAEAQTITFAQA